MEFENAYGIRRAGKMFSGRRGRRTERRRGALVFAVAMSIGGLAYDARPQASVPVYQVVQSGATAAQAASLANALNLPANSLAQSNGMVLYADPSNYVAVPTAEVTDPTITSNLLATTRNLVPAIPIEIRAVDFGALSNLTVLDDAPALNLFSNALMSAGLNLTSAVPVVSHRVFTFYYTNDEANVLSNSQPLDTTIHYQFSLGGYPLIGPGAQVQASYGGDGNVSRLSYAARQLQAGPTVRLVPPSIAAGRFASMFPSNAVVSSPQLVYWSPPFLPWFNGAGNFNPAMILPWYACHATLYITNPATAMVTPVRLKPRMIPGTDDPRFVPSVSLTVTSPAPGQVVANASVTGGTPPYTFIWSASDPEVSSNTGPAIAYSPRLRVPPPPLSMSVSAGPAPQLTISWPASPFSFMLEQSSTFDPPVGVPPWRPVDAQVFSDGENDWVNVPVQTGQNGFFRLRLGGAVQVSDTVGVTVVDANGVSSTTGQPVLTQVNPDRPARPGPPVISWGTESPFEPGGFAVDRIGWQKGMGLPGGGGGIQMFCWTGNTSWPGDFIEPPVPGTLPAKPWVYGCADYSNWGVNTASIVLNNCDGASDFFTCSQPGATVDQYNTAGLGAPINYETVVINLYKGGGTASTHDYHVDYSYSWGPLGPNDNLNWLCMDCCDALDFYGAGGKLPGQRWGKAFGGLHILTGFDSEEAVDDGSFERDFGWFMLTGGLPGHGLPPLTVVQSWFAAGEQAGIDHGVPAVMGPLGKGGTLNEWDHYWGKGTVGPTIPPSQIAGWWSLEDHF